MELGDAVVAYFLTMYIYIAIGYDAVLESVLCTLSMLYIVQFFTFSS